MRVPCVWERVYRIPIRNAFDQLDTRIHKLSSAPASHGGPQVIICKSWYGFLMTQGELTLIIWEQSWRVKSELNWGSYLEYNHDYTRFKTCVFCVTRTLHRRMVYWRCTGVENLLSATRCVMYWSGTVVVKHTALVCHRPGRGRLLLSYWFCGRQCVRSGGAGADALAPAVGPGQPASQPLTQVVTYHAALRARRLGSD